MKVENPGSVALAPHRLRFRWGWTIGGEGKPQRHEFHPILPKQNIVIRISFDTRTNSNDSKKPEAWRQEAAAVLREIAKRISAGEAMPLNLQDRDGKLIGRAREISYLPDPPLPRPPIRLRGQM